MRAFCDSGRRVPVGRWLAVAVVMMVSITTAPAVARANCHRVHASSLVGARIAAGQPLLVDLAPLTPNCYDHAAERRFRDDHSDLGAQLGIADSRINRAAANIEDAVKRSGGCDAKRNRKYSSDKAQVVLTQVIPEAETSIEGIKDDLASMFEFGNSSFALQNKDVYYSLRSNVTTLQRAIDRADAMISPISNLKQAAQNLGKFDCRAAHTGAKVATAIWQDIDKEIALGHRNIAALLNKFSKAPCKDFAPQGAPMSPGQISGAAGGGGTQRGSAGQLSLVAPRRLRVTDGSKLPLTLTAHAKGFVRIELARDRTVVTGISALVNRGSGSVSIEIPNGASHGVAKLSVVFVRSHHVATTTLSIKIT